MIDWKKFNKVVTPAGWNPADLRSRDVQDVSYVAGYAKALETKFGTATGFSVRTRKEGHTFEFGVKQADGSYIVKQLADTSPLKDQVHADLSQNGVLSGGELVPATYLTNNKATGNYTVAYRAGYGVLGGQAVSWPAGSVTCPGEDCIIFVAPDSTVQVATLGAPAALPELNTRLPLIRGFGNTAIYGAGLYAAEDARTMLGSRPRAALRLAERVKASVVQAGPWTGAVRVNANGYINWYFSNIGLLGFVEELPDIVEAHLNLQVQHFYGANPTGEADWTTLHGTPWNGFFAWAYDVEPDEDKTFAVGVKRRADSHDSYASTFVLLAATYARASDAGMTWLENNIEAIKTAIYYNIATRLTPVPSAQNPTGYWTTTFQDRSIYPISYAMDNAEVWAALHAINLIAAEQGLSPDFFGPRQGDEASVLNALQGAWSDTDSKLHYLADLDAGVWGENPMQHFYPDLTVHPVVMFWQPPMHSDSAISHRRQDAAMATMSTLPNWWKSRDYDPFPWLYATGGAVRFGHRDVGLDAAKYIQSHLYLDLEGSFLIHDVGFMRLIEYWLAGQTPALDKALPN